MTVEKKYYIAWNGNKTEGFITADRDDCMKALGRKSPGGYESTLGLAFRETYDDQKMPPIQTVKVLK